MHASALAVEEHLSLRCEQIRTVLTRICTSALPQEAERKERRREQINLVKSELDLVQEDLLTTRETLMEMEEEFYDPMGSAEVDSAANSRAGRPVGLVGGESLSGGSVFDPRSSKHIPESMYQAFLAIESNAVDGHIAYLRDKGEPVPSGAIAKRAIAARVRMRVFNWRKSQIKMLEKLEAHEKRVASGMPVQPADLEGLTHQPPLVQMKDPSEMRLPKPYKRKMTTEQRRQKRIRAKKNKADKAAAEKTAEETEAEMTDCEGETEDELAVEVKMESDLSTVGQSPAGLVTNLEGITFEQALVETLSNPYGWGVPALDFMSIHLSQQEHDLAFPPLGATSPQIDMLCDQLDTLFNQIEVIRVTGDTPEKVSDKGQQRIIYRKCVRTVLAAEEGEIVSMIADLTAWFKTIGKADEKLSEEEMQRRDNGLAKQLLQREVDLVKARYSLIEAEDGVYTRTWRCCHCGIETQVQCLDCGYAMCYSCRDTVAVADRSCGCNPEPPEGGTARPDRSSKEVVKRNPESGLYYTKDQFHCTFGSLRPGFYQKYWDSFVTVHDPNKQELNEKLESILEFGKKNPNTSTLEVTKESLGFYTRNFTGVYELDPEAEEEPADEVESIKLNEPVYQWNEVEVDESYLHWCEGRMMAKKHYWQMHALGALFDSDELPNYKELVQYLHTVCGIPMVDFSSSSTFKPQLMFKLAGPLTTWRLDTTQSTLGRSFAGEWKDSPKLKVAYHATALQNIADILANGLKVGFSHLRGAPKSIYCEGQHRLYNVLHYMTMTSLDMVPYADPTIKTGFPEYDLDGKYQEHVVWGAVLELLINADKKVEKHGQWLIPKGSFMITGVYFVGIRAKDSVEKGNSGFFRLSHRFLKEKARLDGRDGDTIGWEFHHGKLSSRSELARKFGKSR